MAIQRLHKSTNVRFILPLIASALCSACVSSASLHSASQCEHGRLAVCEQFGPQRQCDCEPQHEIDTLLATFGNPAWLGGRH
jgi:hypothetical protein